MKIIFILVATAVILYLIFRNKKKSLLFTGPVPDDWKKFLNDKVKFYRLLTNDEKISFENRTQHFLNTTRITGINTDVTINDRLLVAASAIIPVFAFPEWEYLNLREVLLYPGSFNDNFQQGNHDSSILGMVGSGYMEGKMILSKPSLHRGFENENDGRNVGIHEFVHLIDKADGLTDGLPEVLMTRQYAIPWLDLVREMMAEIPDKANDINPYGSVNPQEFFSVISEYFFERPQQLQQNHPELYEKLSLFFSTDLSKKFRTAKPTKQNQQ